MSRAGRGPFTGIDRVEYHYLKWCLDTEPELWGLAQTASGFALLDRDGLKAFHARVVGTVPWGPRDLRAKIGRKTAQVRGMAESDVRRLASRRTQLRGLASAIAELSLGNSIYLNVGHSNLSDSLLNLLSEAGLRNCIFLHDLIPIKYPDLQREGTVRAFDEKVSVVMRKSDLVITNSKTSKIQIFSEQRRRDGKAPIAVAHLGIDVDPAQTKVSQRNRSYFITIGTIEPRKNHALLLDVWELLNAEFPESELPDLFVVGQRGWVGQEMITRLDQLKSNPRFHELNDLSDREVWSLLKGANALLFPSLDEGFGLPSLEAASLGTPVICGDLAIHRELLGNYPVYLDLEDIYRWKKAIVEHVQRSREELRAACQKNMPVIPSWNSHFQIVNQAIMQLR